MEFISNNLGLIISLIISTGSLVIGLKVGLNDVKHLEKDFEKLRCDIVKIFDEVSDIRERVAKIEGRLNGNK